MFADDPGVGVVVRYGLAAALQQSGDNKAAIELYEKIVAGSGTAFKDSALFNLGLLYERDGQKEKSLEMFRSVEKEFPIRSLQKWPGKKRPDSVHAVHENKKPLPEIKNA